MALGFTGNTKTRAIFFRRNMLTTTINIVVIAVNAAAGAAGGGRRRQAATAAGNAKSRHSHGARRHSLAARHLARDFLRFSA